MSGRGRGSGGPGRHRPSWRRGLWSAAGTTVFALGLLLIAAAALRARLVSPRLYESALERNDAYQRLYTEVLADPELARSIEQYLKEQGLPPETSTRVRVLSTATLRLALPPPRLRSATEVMLPHAVSYLRGDQPTADRDVEVAELVDGIIQAIVAGTNARLAGLAEAVAATVPEYRRALQAFATELAAGRVPRTVPVLAGDAFDPNVVIDSLLDQLGHGGDARVRQQIVAAALAGEQREALTAAAAEFVEGHASKLAEQLRSGRLGSPYRDVLADITALLHLPDTEVTGPLHLVRTATKWFRPPVAVLGAGLMVLGAGILLRQHRSARGTCARLGLACLAGGLAVGATWFAATSSIASPLEPAIGVGPGSWGLPGGLRRLLADIDATLAVELRRTVRPFVLVPLAVGLVLAGAAVAPRAWAMTVPRLAAVAGALGMTVTVGASWWGMPEGRAEVAPGCNGHVDLCDRRYDEVVYGATHNAMASPDAVFAWPSQDQDLRAQLDSGIRALLIDTHYWTRLDSDTQLTAADPHLPPALAAALVASLRPRRPARDGTYLCHSHCALGGTPLVEGLQEIRSFLETNRYEVVTLLVQDGISSDDTVAAFEAAGLEPYLYAKPDDQPWPTLAEMIGLGKRLVVFSHRHDPPPAWIHPAFEHIQDTPYQFRSPDDFTCSRNRGPRNAPLFLMNHWVQGIAPDRATAAVVNRHDVIVARALRCRAQRGDLPNFIAVDFANIGDLTGAVATLNRLRS